MYEIVSNYLFVFILLYEAILIFPPEQIARIDLDGASKFRNPTYDSDEEHTKKKRARLGLTRKNCSASIGSFRQHVNEVLPASVDVDMTEINNFVGDV